MSFFNTNTKLGVTSYILGGAAIVIVAALVVILGTTKPVEAQSVSSCSADLADTFGRGTHSTSGDVAAGTYQVWSRVGLASGSGNASYVLSIGGAGASSNHYCSEQVSASATAPSGGNINWVWVESSPFTWGGSAPITFEFAGNKDGVGLDCIVLRADDVDLSSSGADGCDSSFSTGTGGGGDCGKYDVNSDGNINIVDAIVLLNNRDSSNLSQYDINGDGNINIVDAIVLLNNRNCSE